MLEIFIFHFVTCLSLTWLKHLSVKQISNIFSREILLLYLQSPAAWVGITLNVFLPNDLCWSFLNLEIHSFRAQWFSMLVPHRKGRSSCQTHNQSWNYSSEQLLWQYWDHVSMAIVLFVHLEFVVCYIQDIDVQQPFIICYLWKLYLFII